MSQSHGQCLMKICWLAFSYGKLCALEDWKVHSDVNNVHVCSAHLFDLLCICAALDCWDYLF